MLVGVSLVVVGAAAAGFSAGTVQDGTRRIMLDDPSGGQTLWPSSGVIDWMSFVACAVGVVGIIILGYHFAPAGHVGRDRSSPSGRGLHGANYPASATCGEGDARVGFGAGPLAASAARRIDGSRSTTAYARPPTLRATTPRMNASLPRL